MNKSVTINFN